MYLSCTENRVIIMPTLSSLVAPQVAISANSDAASDDIICQTINAMMCNCTWGFKTGRGVKYLWIELWNNPLHWIIVTSWNGNRWPVDSPHKGPVTGSSDVFFDLRLNRRFCKQSRRRYLRHHRAHYDVTVMWITIEQRKEGSLECQSIGINIHPNQQADPRNYSLGRHMSVMTIQISNHWPLHCFFNSLFR